MKTFQITRPDETIREALTDKINNLTKPKGSLGTLEELALQIGLIQQTLTPTLKCPQNIIFAADHGIVDEGVSLSPKEITWQQISNFLHGGAGVNFLCRQHGFELKIVDAGVDYDLPYDKGIINMKVRKSSRNYLYEAAMTEEEMDLCIDRGAEIVRRCHAEGCNVLSLGEMGIGNTTTSSAVASVLLRKEPELVTGCGAGLDLAGLKRKTKAIRRGIDLHQPDPMDGMDVLQKVGGFDLAAMAGAFLGGAIYHVPVVIDGVIAAAAAAAAGRIAPAATDYMLAAHVSAEPASIWLLDLIGVTPAIRAGLRLGEGTGALALFPLLDMALSIYRDMDTFAEMEIEEYKPLV